MQTMPLPDKRNNRKYLQLTAFTLLCFLGLVYNLSEVPPYHTDENFYVTTSRNMIESKDYITPIYHEKKRFAKPILFYWQVAASYKIFGVNLFSARLVSVFFGALAIPLVYLIARRLFDSKTAMISALLLPGCYLHFQIARWAITDMALNFFVLLVFYFFIKGFQQKENRNTSYYLTYICMGLGFMIKGPPAIIIPSIVIGSYILILRKWKELTQLKLGIGAVILSAIILPWFTTMLAIHGDEFKNHILGAELRDRIIHDTPFSLYYFGVIIRYYLPWSFFLIAALVTKFRSITKTSSSKPLNDKYFSYLLTKLSIWHSKVIDKNNQAFLFSSLWIILPLILFTLFRIEHSRYMLPISAPIVMIIAQFLSQLMSSQEGFESKVFRVPFYLTLIFYFLIVTLIALGIFLLNSHLTAPTGLKTLLVFQIFGLALVFFYYKLKKYFPMIISLSCLQVIILTTLSGDVLSYFNRYPMKVFANKISSDSQSNKHIGLYELGNHRARIGVMTGLPAILLKNPDELKQFIKSKENVYVVMRQTEWEKNFFELRAKVLAVDSGWKKLNISKAEVQSILLGELAFQLKDYSENYILLKKDDE